MAEVKNLTLEINLNGSVNGSVTVIADDDIEFSDLDRLANVTYRETCKLIGDDTNVGDVGTGADDQLAVVLDQDTATDGQQTVHRHLEKTISRAKANEDTFFAQPKDELRLEVRMVDVQNQVLPEFAESNLVEGRF